MRLTVGGRVGFELCFGKSGEKGDSPTPEAHGGQVDRGTKEGTGLLAPRGLGLSR